MAAWTEDELNSIGAAGELQLRSCRRDGTLRSPVTMWVAREGDDLYVRAFRGPDGAWYRGARTRHEGHISAGGVDKDVAFVEEPDSGVNDKIDDAYRAKYRRYGAQYLDPMLAAAARAATIRLVPRTAGA